MSSLTIVMYHYVRDLPRTRYPCIKARLTSDFLGQLDYLARHYVVVSLADCIASVSGGEPLPRNAVVLTFDDGYVDHYETVLPALVERGLTAAFFAPVNAVERRAVLDVNRIHFALAASDESDLMVELFAALDDLRPQYDYPSNEALRASLVQANRYDSADVAFVKHLLQKALPRPARNEVTGRLFRKFVSSDEAAFADDLYMTSAQLRRLLDAGMFLGAHGVSHEWLGEMSLDEQVKEVDGSLAFLSALGVETDHWVMCYPYGSYNESLLGVLRQRGCTLALTTQPDVALLTPENALTLERLDTNDLPTAGTAPIASWTKRVTE